MSEPIKIKNFVYGVFIQTIEKKLERLEGDTGVKLFYDNALRNALLEGVNRGLYINNIQRYMVRYAAQYNKDKLYYLSELIKKDIDDSYFNQKIDQLSLF